MKISLRFLVLLACLSQLISSCMKDTLPETEYCCTEEDLIEVSYEVSVQEPCITKGTISKNTPVWAEGEKVSVYDPIASKARVFTVNSVKDGRILISGTISPGVTTFSAVYPAECVSSWKSISNPVYAAPTAQTIPSGGNIATNALISRAYNTDLSKKITFENKVALLQFKVDRSDIENVTFNLGDGTKTYTVTTEDGTFQNGTTYYITVDAKTYSSVKAVCTTEFDVTYTKTSSKSLSAAVNSQKNLGIVSNGTRHINYTTFTSSDIPETIAGIDGFLDVTGALEDETVKSFYDNSIIQSSLKDMYKKYIPYYKSDAHTICFKYKSIDPQGEPVTLSAMLMYPESTLSGFVLANHFSITKNAECPTNTLQAETALCWKGYVIVMPDYYGFGASKSYPQSYLNADVTARGNIDALLAAKQILADKGISAGSQIYNVGYSQGAHSALANVKYLSEHSDCGITFTKTFAGGGPYDVELTWNKYLSGAYPDASGYVAAAMCSFIESEKLDVSYSDVFQDPLLSNYKSWILSKKYTAEEITKKIGTTDITKILTSSMTSKTGDAYKKIMATAKKYSLTSKSWSAPSGSQIYIYHSSDDEMVPYENKASMVKVLKAGGCTPVQDLDLVTVKNKKCYTDTFTTERTIFTLAMTFGDFDTVTHEYGSIFFAVDAIMNRW